MTSCIGAKYDTIIVHKAYYLFTYTCFSINLFHNHSHIKIYTKAHKIPLYFCLFIGKMTIFPYFHISISNLLCRNLGMCKKKTHLASLYILQKRIVRTITFADKLAHTGPIFKDIEVLPLAKLIHCRIGLFMYKIFYKLQPTVINKMYDQNVDIHVLITQDKNIICLWQRAIVIFTLKASIAAAS